MILKSHGKYFSEEQKSRKNKIRKTLTVVCMAAVLTASFSFAASAATVPENLSAKTTTSVLYLRDTPTTTANVLQKFTANSQVTILDTSNPKWYRVKTADGSTGYCITRYLDITTESRAAATLPVYEKSSKESKVLKTYAPGESVDVVVFINSAWAKVKLEDGTIGYAAISKLIFVTDDVKNAPNIALPESTMTVKVGEKIKLIPKNNTGDVKWESSNPSVVSVTSGGWIQGVSSGSAVITAVDSKTGKTAKCTVKSVKTDFISLTISPASKTITASQSFTLTATTTPVTTGKVKFKSSNTAVAKVDSNGKVTGVAPGTATITVYDSTGLVSRQCAVTVKTAATVTLSSSSVTVNEGSLAVITAKVTNSSSTAVTWRSNNTSVAGVNNGRISGLKAGTATITATDSTGTVTASCKVTVKSVSSGSLSVSHSTRAANAGKSIYIKGYGSGWWETSDSEIATVSEGFIYCKKPGDVAISYVNSSGQKAVCAVTVHEAAPIRFVYSSPNSATLNSNVTLVAITDKTRTAVKFNVNVNGTNVVVNATSKVADGNTYIWKGTYKTTKAGTFDVTAYAQKDGVWKTNMDGKADIYVTSKTNASTTGLDRLRASDSLISFIGEKEGFVSKITYDTLANNLPTIGYGYVVWSGNAFYNNLTQNEAYALLVDAVNNDSYTSRVNDMLIGNNVRFNQQQFDALVSFSYNLGTGWTYSSDLRNILLNSYGTVSSGTTMTGTVTSDTGLNLRQEPTTASDVITVLSYGETVTLVSTTKYNSVWYQVKTSSGLTGYCSGTYLNVTSSSGTATGRDLRYVNKNALIKEMLAYHHASGVCYYGLLYRRVDELEMFLYNDYVSDGRSNKHGFPSPSCLSF